MAEYRRQARIIVTGAKDVDAALAAMPSRLRTTLSKGAVKKSGKRFKLAVKNIIEREAYDTGAFYKSIDTSNVFRKKSPDRIGIAAFPTRAKLRSELAKVQAKARKKSGNSTLEKINLDYYPAFLEFGTGRIKAVMPFRRALYDNVAAYRAYFVADLRQFIRDGGTNQKIEKATGFIGKNFKK